MSDKVLIELLAATNAIWWPHRYRAGHPGAIAERRALFQEGGVLWRPAGPEASAKAALRELDGLVSAGLATRTRRRAQSDTLTKLTDAGQIRAMAIVGDLSFWKATPEILADLDLLKDDPASGADAYAGWIPETTFAGKEWGERGAEKDFADVAMAMLPAMARGLAQAGSSTQGHVWYRITNEGRHVLDHKTWPPVVAGLPKFSKQAGSHYEASFRRELSALRSSAPVTGEIGDVPLPVSMPTIGKKG